jgi:CCR4-NOT transcription complex subunit 7/8
MVESGLLFNDDFGLHFTVHMIFPLNQHLIKIMTPHRKLRTIMVQFMQVMRLTFVHRFYDMKHMMKFCNGLYGALEKVANTLGVQRVAGKSH